MQHPQQKPHPYKVIAFVLGNGKSRLAINLDTLQEHGVVYGCNAIYRDFTPSYLIAVDAKMVIELNENRVQDKTSVWTNNNRKIENFTNINFFVPHRGWSSGPSALWLAAQHDYQEIYFLGFDYSGIMGKHNNVYSDTPNYRKSTDNATYSGNWERQTAQVIKEFPATRFIRVIPQGSYIPQSLITTSDNFSHMNLDEFEKNFK